MPRRLETCPSCRAFLDQGASACPYCGVGLRVRRRGAWGAVVKAFEQAPVTHALMLSILALFGAEIWMDQRLGVGGSLLQFSSLATARLGANWYPLNVGEREPWRLVTAIFLHGGLVHLLFNAWVLVDLVRLCEQIYGPSRVIAVYLLSGVAGSAVSLLWNGERFHNVGASGALCGLIGLMAVYGIGRRGDLGAAAVRGAMGRWLVYIGVLGFLLPGIDNAAHFGGAGAGAAIGLVLAGDAPRRSRAWTRYVWRPLAGTLVAGTLLAFGAMGTNQTRWEEADRLAQAVEAADRFRDALRAASVSGGGATFPAAALRGALLDFTGREEPDPELAEAREAAARAARAWIAGEGSEAGVAGPLGRYEAILTARAERNRFRVGLLLAMRDRPD